jgi:hypothetical protein
VKPTHHQQDFTSRILFILTKKTSSNAFGISLRNSLSAYHSDLTAKMVYQPSQSNSCDASMSTIDFQRDLYASAFLPLFPATLLRLPVSGVPPSSHARHGASSVVERRRSRAAALIAVLDEALAIVEDIEDDFLFFQDE